MQYLTSKNMSSLNTPKIHKMGNPTDTPWMQSSATNMSDPYYGHSINSNTSSDTSDVGNNYSMNESNSSIDQHTTTGKSPDGKPPYSYATLIKYAIERSAENKLTLSQIYQWVIDHYPYYGTAGSGWKNSIRHNLSLNKSFVRVPRPVNEPGKGSYWTVDQYAAENEHNVRSTVRGRSGRSSSDSSLHRASSAPWLYRNSSRYYRDGRSLSNDADTNSIAATRRSSQYGYCSHPYGSYDRSFSSHPYGYPSYHYPQRMPSHETLLSARQNSSVTYSLPASATVNSQQQHFGSFSMSNSSSNMYLNNSMQQSALYSHRQSCPDISSIPSATYSETNMLPNFNTTSTASTGNEMCLDSSSCDKKSLYSNSQTFGNYVSEDSQAKTIDYEPTTIKSEEPFYHKKHNMLPGLPSPVMSSATSPSSSSQHLSVADPLAMVPQHPSPVTTTSTTAPGNRISSPYLNFINNNGLAQNSSKEISPSSPLDMNDKPSENSPQQNLCSSTSYSLKIEAGSPQTQSLKYLSPTDEGYLQDEDQNLISSQTEDYGYP